MATATATTTPPSSTPPSSQGVSELVTRLREDGVNAGRAQAKKILAEAEAKAASILAEAEREAAHKINEAVDRIAREKKSAEEAVQLAYRDTVLDFQRRLSERFAGDVKRLTGNALDDAKTIRALLYMVAVATIEELGLHEEEPVNITVPPGVIDRSDPLLSKVQSLAHRMAKERIILHENIEAGRSIFIEAREGKIALHLTTEGLADAILTHLQPRFKALLDGAAG